jgi:hypothetical protein
MDFREEGRVILMNFESRNVSASILERRDPLLSSIDADKENTLLPIDLIKAGIITTDD